MKIIAGFKGRLLAAAVCFMWSISAVSGELVVNYGYARATPPGASSAAAYLTLRNETANKVLLVGVISNGAKQVMIHQNQLQGDMMRMRHVSQLEIAAGSQVGFEPGGHHLMLTGLAKPLRAGERLQLSLQFQQGNVLEVSLPILAVDAIVEMKMNSHHE